MMSVSPLRSTDSATYSGPNRQELGGAIDWTVGIDSSPSDGAPGAGFPPEPQAPSPRVSREDSKNYAGPSRLELASLTEWAIETKDALTSDPPMQRPSGRPRKEDSAARRGVVSTPLVELSTSNSEVEHDLAPNRPPADTFLQEIDQIWASLQKRATPPSG